MKEFKGTPGPWSAVQQYADEVSVIDSDGFKVVTAERTAILMDWDKKGFEHWGDDGGSRHLYGPEQFANSYLIAAAPDLLKELQRLRDYVINICGVDDGDCDAEHPLMSSMAAIRKALGE